MLVRRYEMPWRRAYEVYAGIAWWLALLYFLGVGVAGPLPRQLALPLALACFVMGALRVAQASRMLVLRASLGGRPELASCADWKNTRSQNRLANVLLEVRVCLRGSSGPL